MDDGERFTATTRIEFESLGQYLCWLDSPERRHLLYQAETLMNYRYHANLEADSLDRWIQMKRSKKIPIWKVNLLVWLALCPSIMVWSCSTIQRWGLCHYLSICWSAISLRFGWLGIFWCLGWVVSIQNGCRRNPFVSPGSVSLQWSWFSCSCSISFHIYLGYPETFQG